MHVDAPLRDDEGDVARLQDPPRIGDDRCGRAPTSPARTARSRLAPRASAVRRPRRARRRPRTARPAPRGRGSRTRPRTASRAPPACALPVAHRSASVAPSRVPRRLIPERWYSAAPPAAGVACARGRVRQGARARPDRPSWPAEGSTSPTFWRESTEAVATRRAALHVALLVHARPGVAAGHEPLPGRDPGAAAGVARARVLRGRLPQDGRRRPLRARGSRRCTRRPAATRVAAPRWNQYMQPVRRRPGAARRPAHAAGRRLGHAGPLPRAGPAACSTPTRSASCARSSPYLAEGARRGLLVGEAADPEGPDAPGLVVLGRTGASSRSRRASSAGSPSCPTATGRPSGKLPPSVLAVAGRALRTAEHADAPGEVALARVLSRAGRWMVLHGAALVADGARRVAVIVEPAHPARISPLLMAAYGLTEREQDVTRLVLQGDSTAQIAEQLCGLAPHRPAAPEERVRQDGRAQPARPRRQGVLLPLRAAPARQRAARRSTGGPCAAGRCWATGRSSPYSPDRDMTPAGARRGRRASCRRSPTLRGSRRRRSFFASPSACSYSSRKR